MRGRRTPSVAIAVGAALLVPLLAPTVADAAATDVVINEIMYNPPSDLGGDEFLELHNRGPEAVDVSGWSFAGITLTFAAGTSIGPNGYLVVSPDPVRFQQTYGRTAAATYTGGLSNGGETISLRDATSAVIDTVAYTDRAPWPGTPDGEGASLELVDPNVENNDFLDWAGSIAAAGWTPGVQNSVRRNGLAPRITAVSANPAVPAAGQAVTVTATVTGQDTAVVRYRTDFAAEQTVMLQPAGGDVYTAQIPGAAAGHLIRYRVEAANGAGTSRVPRSDDTTVYLPLVVASGVTSPIRMLEWFISDADYNAIVGNPTADIERTGAIAYNGQVVDNVVFNIRGANSQTAPKPNWKVQLPHNYDLDLGLLEPVDEFAMQGDWSDKSHGRPNLAWEAYQRAGVVDTQVFPLRVQRNAAFQGLYTYIDLFDGTWRDREGYGGSTQLFKASTGAFDASRPLVEVRWEKKNPADGDFAPIQGLLAGVALSGSAERDYMLASTDIPQLINYAAVTAIVEHHDSSSKNFYAAQDPVTGRWEVIPWDLDHTFGNGCCQVTSTFVTPAEPSDKTSEIMVALLAQPQWRDMYFRRLRTLVDDVLAPGRIEALYDARLGPAQPVIASDFAAWPYTGTTGYASARTSLFNAVAARRSVMAADSRVPSPQPAAPAMVIDELHVSPVAGDTAGFVELYNPSATTAIDLSGWQLTGAVSLTVQPGTVVLPRSTMTFVSNDPAFRTASGSTVFVGDRYSGALEDGETITLTRRDGSTADTLTYGGEGWPVPAAGSSLELVDPAADNSVGGSWRLSPAAGGSPGRLNAAPAVQVPSAPTIGTATAGNAQAVVRWTAPADDGGGALTGYQVRVVDGAGAPVGTLRPAPATANALTVTGLANGSAYRFQVSASNSAGSGPFSALSAAVTPTATTAPGPPVIGTPSRGAAGSPLTAIARWTPPTTTGGSPVTGYRVTALRMSSSAANATVLGTTVSPLLGAGVRQRSFTLANGNYRFQVVAINAIGTGAPSARSSNVVPR